MTTNPKFVIKDYIREVYPRSYKVICKEFDAYAIPHNKLSVKRMYYAVALEEYKKNMALAIAIALADKARTELYKKIAIYTIVAVFVLTISIWTL